MNLGFTGCGKTRPEPQEVSGHDRGTLWVACRKRRKINEGFSPWGMLFGLFARTQAFFRSLFGPYVNSSFR
jgi:hypothetical protein